ncbi:MAG: M23 family metallopeptidase [Pyrinomonadaceae bacterium]|nr:M23 family metallopeptidase [Pyrinomonadaceae bacterium]
MQKDDKFYTFLLTHSSKSRIYIRRIEVSKKWLHSFAASAVLTVGLATASIGFALNAENLQPNNQTETSPVIQQVAAVQPVNNQPKSIDYDRPTDSTNNLNTGGPSSLNFQLATEENESNEGELEAQIKKIEATSNPDFFPNVWAHVGKINNEFGFRRNPFGGRSYEFHPGLDIDGERGDIVLATANGTVSKAGWTGGYGNLIEIDHGNGLKTRFGHLSKIEIKEGDTIQRGQEIGLIGSTGRSTGPHLHYEVRLDDKAINPRRFLPPEMLK